MRGGDLACLGVGGEDWVSGAKTFLQILGSAANPARRPNAHNQHALAPDAATTVTFGSGSPSQTSPLFRPPSPASSRIPHYYALTPPILSKITAVPPIQTANLQIHISGMMSARSPRRLAQLTLVATSPLSELLIHHGSRKVGKDAGDRPYRYV